MIDLGTLSPRLRRGDDGIWYAPERTRVSYPAEGALQCAQIEDRSFWFRHRTACIVQLVLAHPPRGQGAIFDVGGGNGHVARGLAQAGFDVVVVEPSPEGARMARQRGIAQVACSTLGHAGFAAGSLPAVGLFDVLEHIEDDASFMRSVHRLLGKRGRIYLSVPAYRWLWSNEDAFTGHYHRYALRSLESLLDSTGFALDFSTYIFRVLPLPILLTRTLPSWLSARHAGGRAMARDHAFDGGPGARILEALLRGEVQRVRRSRPMAFGASCLVAASKR